MHSRAINILEWNYGIFKLGQVKKKSQVSRTSTEEKDTCSLNSLLRAGIIDLLEICLDETIGYAASKY